MWKTDAKLREKNLPENYFAMKDPSVAMDAAMIFMAGYLAERKMGSLKKSEGDENLVKNTLKSAGLNVYGIKSVVEAKTKDKLEKYWGVIVFLADKMKEMNKTQYEVDEIIKLIEGEL
jgi:hypothetical protein